MPTLSIESTMISHWQVELRFGFTTKPKFISSFMRFCFFISFRVHMVETALLIYLLCNFISSAPSVFSARVGAAAEAHAGRTAPSPHDAKTDVEADDGTFKSSTGGVGCEL
jgi:hypothetical protein